MLFVILGLVKIILIAVAILAVTAILLIAVVFTVDELTEGRSDDKRLAKMELRRKKEASAEGYFFQESHVREFETTGRLVYQGRHKYPTADAGVYYRLMDKLADDTTVQTIEEL